MRLLFFGGSPREGVRSTPKRGSPRGVGSEVRAEQRLAAGGAAPPTRNKCASYFSGGRRGKECGLPRSAARRAEWAARYERSNDWRRGAQRPRPVLSAAPTFGGAAPPTRTRLVT